MAGVLATIKKLYSGEGAVVKHICWFVLAFLGVILQAPSSSSVSSPADIGGLLALSAIPIIYGLVLTIYSFGYNCIIMHNRFEEEGKPLGFDILPEFDILPFKITGRAFVLIIVWMLYSLLLAIVIAIPILGIFIYLAVVPFIAFAQVAYSKEFKTEGLYNLSILVKFFRLFWFDAISLWFRIFICGLSVAIILFLIATLLGFNFTNLIMTGQIPPALNFIFAIMQYVSIVLGFVNAYGMADIYAKKWDDSSY